MNALMNHLLYAVVAAAALTPLRLRAQGYTITVSRVDFILGEEVRAAWKFPPWTFHPLAWVGLFLTNASDRDFIERKYTFLRGNETDFVPPAPGVYHFRLFSSGYTKVATSASVTVLSVVPDLTKIRNFPGANRAVIAFGDSLVKGVGATEGHDMVSLLSERMGVPILNKGVAGDTTAAALSRLARDVLKEDPQVVLLLLGGNDLLNRVPATNIVGNLKVIITRMQERGAVVLLLGVQGGAFTDRFADSFRSLAEETGAGYVPNILRGIIESPFLRSDTVHPNDVGYKIMAERVLPALQQLYLPKLPLRLTATRRGALVELQWPTLTNRQYRVHGSETVRGARGVRATVMGTGSVVTNRIFVTRQTEFFQVEEVR